MKNAGSTALLNHPYSIGVELAVNAVKDAFLLLDAPVCAIWRPGFIQGSHDSTSTLWDSEGVHRVQVSGTRTDLIVSGNLKGLALDLGRLATAPGCGAVLAAGFPMARISGAPYETVWRSLEPKPKVPFFPVLGGAMSDDWLDGYAHTLLALAKGISLPKAARRPKDVAIVGYLHDRGERDHAANVSELRRMLAAIGLNLVSVWPGGTTLSELRAAASAGAILSFPYAREAAARLAGRLGTPLVECGLPLGLGASTDWLVQVGTALGRRARAEAFAENELARLLPRLEWAVEEVFLHSTFVFTGDPFLLRPLARQISDLGGRMLAAVAMAGPHHQRELGAWDDLPFPVRMAPSESSYGDLMRELSQAEGRPDCLLGLHDGKGQLEQRTVELGFPSYHSHAFHDRPYLGFEGAVCLLSRVAEELRWSKAPGRR
jgi:nitrogenase molybdenum-iron protein alpha/beta subunit